MTMISWTKASATSAMHARTRLRSMWNDALQMHTKGRQMLNEARKVRGYFKRSEPLTNEQKAEREARLGVLMKNAPCRGCN